MRALLFAIVASSIAISVTVAQTTPKPGQCAPSLPLEVCEKECKSDGDCKGINKCCATKCGGAVCSFPVSINRRVDRPKPGYCPNPPKGPWVCSSTCNVDTECRGRAKCCRNRCGALVCTTPESERPTAPAPQPDAGAPAPQPDGGAPAPHPIAGALAPHPVAGAPAPHPIAGAPAPHPVAGVPAPHPIAGDNLAGRLDFGGRRPGIVVAPAGGVA